MVGEHDEAVEAVRGGAGGSVSVTSLGCIIPGCGWSTLEPTPGSGAQVLGHHLVTEHQPEVLAWELVRRLHRIEKALGL